MIPVIDYLLECSGFGSTDNSPFISDRESNELSGAYKMMNLSKNQPFLEYRGEPPVLIYRKPLTYQEKCERLVRKI